MKSVQQNLISILKEHNARKYLAITVWLFALITVAAVFWALRISGLTLADEDQNDGAEVHTFTDAGYDSASVTEATDTDAEEDTGTLSLNSGHAAITSPGISLTSDDTNTTLTSDGSNSGTSAEDKYYFTDTTTLDNAASAQDESYIVYTKIGNIYYLVSANDTLVACTYLNDASDIANSTADEGVYCWTDPDTGELVFKCTTTGSDDAFEDYRWTLSGTDSGTDSSGSGTYTLYNSEKSVYIAPQNVGVSETLTGTAWWTGSQTGKDYALEADQMLIFTIYCTDGIAGDAAFSVELYDNTTYPANAHYLTTGSDGNAWLADANSKETPGGTVSGMLYPYSSNVASGTTYIVTVERTDLASSVPYIITYYNQTTGTTHVTITAADTDLIGDPVNVHIMAQIGTYQISAVYAVAKEVAGTENDDQTDTTEETMDFSALTDISTDSANRMNEMTLSGDFNITYQFYNQGTNSTSGASSSAGKGNNYVLAFSDGTDSYVYVKPSYEYVISGASVTVSESGEEPSDWRDFANKMNAGYSSYSSYTMCKVNVVRVKNAITVTTGIYRNSTTSPSYTYTVTIVYEKVSDITLYITGIACVVQKLTVSDDSAGYDVTGYDACEAVGSWGTSLVLKGASDGSIALATATSRFLDGVTLAADSTSAMSFMKSGASNTTFYLARVREYTV